MSEQATIDAETQRVPIRSTALFATVCRVCNCHLMRRKQQSKKAICALCKTELDKRRKKEYYLQNQEAIKSKQRVRGKLATQNKQRARLIAQPEPFNVTCECGATLTRVRHPGKAYSKSFTCSKCKHERKLTWQKANRETWSDEKRNLYLEGRKAKDRAYYQEHKATCKNHSRKSERRAITEIRPSYVKKLFKREGLTEIPTVLIEVRQKLIEIKRIIKNENNASNP
jgi:DNA-directed RNA polymerase subunit M/transcription elongation factor TFIIS